MDSLIYGNVCRICLQHNVSHNWNDEIPEFCGISYKDCYYRYTTLTENGSDCFPTNLCDICANELKNAHILFQKALDSNNILQTMHASKVLEKSHSNMDTSSCLPAMKCETESFVEVSRTDDRTIMERESDASLTSLYDNERIPKPDNNISEDEHVPVEPSHFIDIENFEIFNTETLKIPSRMVRNRRKKSKLVLEKMMEKELGETYNTKLPNTKKNFKRKKFEPTAETTLAKLQENPSTKLIESSASKEGDENIKIQPAISLELNLTDSSNSKLVSYKSAKKSREKYLLMCAYCSLKVEGASKLAKHEATHNENRKRTETCNQCGLKLFTKLSLTEHMKIHDENRQKNHKCEFCEKAFFNKGALNVHRRVHLGLMVKCQICSKEFFRQVDLDKHLLKHSASPLQKNVGKKKYAVECEYCNKSVLTDKWKEHIAAHLDQPQVKCKICDKKFFARTKCTKHLKRVHHKNLSEYEDFIHYYVDRNTRMSSLMMKQQLTVQPLVE